MKSSMTFALLASVAVPALSALSCQSASGKAVDWFAVLKHANSFDGSYLDSKSETSFKETKVTLDDDDEGPLAYTLNPVYDMAGGKHRGRRLLQESNSSIFDATLEDLEQFNFTKSSGEIGYAFYNDEEPNDKKQPASRAHSKGVIAFDGTSGFWLLHSVPLWPPPLKKGFSGLFDKKFGQSFLCVSFTKKTFNDIAKQQQINFPQIYESDLPDSLAKGMDDFDDWIGGTHITDATTNVMDLKSKGGHKFKHFAKNKKSAIELYGEFVAPELDTDMYAETWQNGGHLCGPWCKKGDHKVIDIDSVSVNGAEWTIHQDHSKWAISTPSSKKHWVCIGDINRETPQTKRGGGTMCLNDAKMHKTFLKTVSEVNDKACGKKSQMFGAQEGSQMFGAEEGDIQTAFF